MEFILYKLVIENSDTYKILFKNIFFQSKNRV